MRGRRQKMCYSGCAVRDELLEVHSCFLFIMLSSSLPQSVLLTLDSTGTTQHLLAFSLNIILSISYMDTRVKQNWSIRMLGLDGCPFMAMSADRSPTLVQNESSSGQYLSLYNTLYFMTNYLLNHQPQLQWALSAQQILAEEEEGELRKHTCCTACNNCRCALTCWC